MQGKSRGPGTTPRAAGTGKGPADAAAEAGRSWGCRWGVGGRLHPLLSRQTDRPAGGRGLTPRLLHRQPSHADIKGPCPKVASRDPDTSSSEASAPSATGGEQSFCPALTDKSCDQKIQKLWWALYFGGE